MWYGGNSSDQGEWLLDIGKGGTSLLGDSRDVLPVTSNSPSSCAGGEDQIITPDGSAIACGAGNSSGSAFEEFSTKTGAHTRTLVQWTGSGQIEVLWSNPSGSVLVGEAPGTAR